ncbi:MFS transporter [Thermosphaera chiliense]|uniref:MFS transporter n=1 Tax=Thermosphaera chiliense TaxID=3402707 RepID=A0A7M1UPV4_9CREN|nr:MFS transporter [Thermosphaera aggregans]QOR94231.1 MFS transporter [Thermosphaera aggregans]
MRLGNKVDTDVNRKVYLAETATYNFAVNISIGMSNALLIRLLSYGVSELGLLTFVRILAYGVSQVPAALLVEHYRHRRKMLWNLFGAINRLGPSLLIFSLILPKEYSLSFALTISFLSQFAGGVAGVAATHVLADIIPVEESPYFFSKVNQLNYVSISLAFITSFATFALIPDYLVSYQLLYAISFTVGLVSTLFLVRIKDPKGFVNHGRSMTRLYDDLEVVKFIFTDKRLRRYLLVISLFNFSVNIPAPFWDYIVMVVIGGNELIVVLKNVVSLAVKSVGMFFWKREIVKFGLRKVTVVGMASTAVVPILYKDFATTTSLLGIEAVSGYVWAPLDLSIFLYNAYLPPKEVRPAYLSLLGLTINSVSSLASMMGTIIAVSTGDVGSVLLASSVLRGVTASIAYATLPEVEEKSTGVRK